MKYAIILPGNLATYFASLDVLEKICCKYDIDVYILYSTNINYIHLLYGNKNIDVNVEDIDIINSKLKHHIKFFKSIEETDDYNNIINEKINIFQTNILWTKKSDIKRMDLFRYEDFMDNNRTKKYIDQFVRINYLYKIIEKNQINYDYIIRARIDQYIDYNILDSIITSLNNNIDKIYPIISCGMDNFFIVGKTHFDFFDYLLNHIGEEGLKYDNIDNSYVLGPEVQFLSTVNSFFTKIYYFGEFNIHIEITFCIKINNDNILIFSSKNTNGIWFGKYIEDKFKENKTTYAELLENDPNITKIYGINPSIILKKYTTIDDSDDNPIVFYAIVWRGT